MQVFQRGFPDGGDQLDGNGYTQAGFALFSHGREILETGEHKC